MGSIYRSPGDERTLRAWCRQQLAGRATTTTLATSLGETALVTVGEGSRTVLYLAGTSFNAATSVTILDAFAGAGFRAVCADLPGQPGLSAAEQPSDDAYGAWADEVLRHLRDGGASTLHAAGHSRGAAVALAADPALVDGLVLASPAGLVDVRPGWAVLRATVPWMVRRSDAGSRGLAQLMAGPGQAYPEGLVPWLSLAVRSAHPTGAPKRLPDDVLHRWRGRPVAVLVGEHDCFFPPATITARTPADLGVTATVVPGAGHLLVDQAPEAVVRALVGL